MAFQSTLCDGHGTWCDRVERSPGFDTKLAGRPVVPDLLVRRRPTPSQGGLGRAGRRRNVAGAFALRPGREAQVRGRRILLIDDVHTTGATLGECARALRRAGAASVDALTLARVTLADG